ncbi:Holliday junction resolvase RecU [Aneurinibacillus migulanus]|uniref:Holliday junction resolvase RecU n=2 Tax=Aneurinibacillus migulanus TaxID=47500 RepID=A0A1G8I0L2_ANEMI|nr:Holliday junction resolvase RecU [Aneurinibacillus migulanus]MED0892964.1 Holliday junction resolvase RecU [Aneurinibacillus migulanus]MED1614728.1 Holliday junction resolvase RecU [Aneurinibacillus migulanus]MED4729045.1 Holliday junction resolvase RecU [Aneurinibacillus migulanus]SDI12281.1 recombination protein U [Aneurinibacillus migulanus]GED17074.1 Holliday junction resolvase RecU [Aneurinibacillus migulanus]
MRNIRYPNGKLPTVNREGTGLPDRMKAEEFLALVQGKQDSAANRGMSLEEELNESNAYYVSHDIASVHKKPTPVQIVKVDYPSRSAAVIREAYFRQPSTTDYNGVFEGRYLDFEAKETRNKTALPLGNFHEHQINHMCLVVKQRGIAFAIVRFTVHDETYVLDASHIIHFWKESIRGGRKSIPYAYIKEHGHLIPVGYRPRLDYLSVVKQYYFS